MESPANCRSWADDSYRVAIKHAVGLCLPPGGYFMSILNSDDPSFALPRHQHCCALFELVARGDDLHVALPILQTIRTCREIP
jgi:hypothetical protein